MDYDLISYWNIYKGRIIAQIRKKVRNADAAADILQEVFIKFWENHNDIKENSKTFHWLSAVTRNTIADFFRESEKNKTDSGSGELLQSTQDELEQADESKKLLPILYSLPAKYRNILLLSDIHGLPHKIISEQLNLSVDCIKQRVVRGRKLVAEKMKCCCNFTHDKYGNIVQCSEKAEYRELIKKLKDSDVNLSPF
jgi:RNA polymerase sigma-70 factor (ECF subfamily)